jgi:hypothetical protein
MFLKLGKNGQSFINANTHSEITPCDNSVVPPMLILAQAPTWFAGASRRDTYSVRMGFSFVDWVDSWSAAGCKIISRGVTSSSSKADRIMKSR